MIGRRTVLKVGLAGGDKDLAPGVFHDLPKGTRIQVLSGAHGYGA